MVGKKGRSGCPSKGAALNAPMAGLGTEVSPRPLIRVRITSAIVQYFPEIKGRRKSRLVSRLQDVGGWYEAGILRTNAHRRGRPANIAVQILLADCRDAVYMVADELPKVWQRPLDEQTGTAESRIISLARAVAQAYGRPLSINLRRQIKNAKRFHFS
jgi:hypothetical protein